MSLVDAYRLHISGSTFNQIAGHHNEYKIAGDLVQPQEENGITILQRSISGDAFYNSEQRFPPPQCHPDTRTAVQDTIQAWAAEGHQAPGVMWLYGPAGAGKSAVAQSMAEKWSVDKLAAAFFFGRWRAGGSSGKSLFPTIAYQLALHIPQLRKPIGLAVEVDPAICDKTLEEQARALIVNPMEELDVAGTSYLVIIDGLDECEGKAIQSRIVKILFHMISDKKLPIMFLICSRPELHIRETFDSLPPETRFRRLVLDETFHPGRDILRYLRDSFADIQYKRFPNHFGMEPSWPSERDLDTLVYSASGQFIYAATVIKFVDDEYCHPVEQLNLVLSLSKSQAGRSVFADLDALYTFILSANPNVSLLLRILGTYFAIPYSSLRNNCVSFLDDILGLARGSVRLALRGLHSLLLIPDSDDRRIRVHHASLQDFLWNPQRAGIFFLDMAQHHNDLARRCFSIVQHTVESPGCYSSAISSYAHRSGRHHFQLVQDHQDLIFRCLKCFQDSLETGRLRVLCRDAKTMLLRFWYIIDFLETMDEYKYNTRLTRALNCTWDLLLMTVFDPNPDVLEFYEAWGTESFEESQILIIHSSLALLIQKLWGTDETPRTRQSRQRVRNFLNWNATPEVKFRVAQISLRLLMCRTAELKTLSTGNYLKTVSEGDYLKIVPEGNYLSSYPVSRRSTHWEFASEWCRALIDAPPVPELLGILKCLFRDCFLTGTSELNRDGLIGWLKNFGDEVAPLLASLEKHEPPVGGRYWIGQSRNEKLPYPTMGFSF